MAAAAATSREGGTCLPSRFQCPLCLDLLTSPVQLPCCRKHLCLACFDRAVELTSTNCAFCRKRIVSFARRQSKKVDDTFWAEIQTKTKDMDVSAISFDSDDVDDRSRPTNSAAPGELHTYYEQCKSEVERERYAREQEELAATLRFLEAEAAVQSTANTATASVVATPTPVAPLVYSIFMPGSSPAPRRHAPPARKGSFKKSRPSFHRNTPASKVLPSKKRWTCPACTYMNVSVSHVCAMCHTKAVL